HARSPLIYFAIHTNPNGPLHFEGTHSSVAASELRQPKAGSRKPAVGSRNAKLSIVMLTHLECTRCGEHYPADRPQSVCPKDAGVLYARYDLAAIKRSFSSGRLAGRAPTMWR